MRVPALALAVLLVVLAASGPRAAAEDFAAVGSVNKLLGNFTTPQLAPGDSGAFRFQLNSTYSSPIFNVKLNASIYRYATIDGSIPVDANWTYPFPKIAETGGRMWWHNWTAPVQPGSVTNLSFTIVTSADSSQMPHGSLFNQASYFVRFWLEFDGNVSGNMTHYRFASKGFFTTNEWDEATNRTNTNPCNPPSCRGNLNLTFLGVDGVIPDSAFGVLEPIPRWPFYLLVALAGFFLILAFLFWVEENPDSYPRVAAWWARTRGRMRRMTPARRRRPDAPPEGKSPP